MQQSKKHTTLITGAGSGIGLEFVKQYATKGWNVIATHRHQTVPSDLAAVATQSPLIRIEQLDVTSEFQARALADKLGGKAIDVLINNAGVAYDENMSLETQDLGSFSWPLFDRIFAVNVRGPLLVTEALLPNVKTGTEKKIVYMSSTTGSLAEPLPGSSGTFYRASKAALNRAVMNLAEALRGDGITVVPFHPGAVLTEKNQRFGQPYPNMISTEFSVGHMINTISRIGPADSGRFIRYDGAALSW